MRELLRIADADFDSFKALVSGVEFVSLREFVAVREFVSFNEFVSSAPKVWRVVIRSRTVSSRRVMGWE